MKLDLVYTFVDNTDDVWRSKYHQYYQNMNSLRYNFNQEIIFSLRTAEKYFNWVNKIYIVSDNQKFCLDFLSASFREKISFVDHTEIIPKQFLPCFNSIVIESYLHKIKGIEEHFAFMNDDVFIGQPLTVDHFFSCGLINQYFILKKHSIYSSCGYGCCCDSTYNLFHKKWIDTSDCFPVNGHMIHILRKETCEKLWRDFEKELLITSAVRTRTDDKWGKERYSFLFLILHAMELYRTNSANFLGGGIVYQDITKEDYYFLIRNRPKVFCINNILNVDLWKKFNEKFLRCEVPYV